ncbi:MAG: CDGSH iron-sulfur domain-containing protein [Bellilinea sp.]|jgi:CDGSH-type Zn-finger protein/uncharacterized Fe-S cluster protein YjdI
MRSDPKRYTSSAINVTYDVERCIHAAECVRGLPQVFDTNRRPWIQPENASPDQIAAVIERCPTGALQYTRKDGAPDEAPPPVNRATLVEDGPLYLHGQIEIRSPQGDLLYATTRVALCRCGASRIKPFCDNSHLQSGFRAGVGFQVSPASPPDPSEGGAVVVIPQVNKSLKVTGALEIINGGGGQAERTSETYLCRCGASESKPFCDGSHRRVGFTG